MPKIIVRQLFDSVGLDKALSDVRSLVEANSELSAAQEVASNAQLANLGKHMREVQTVNKAYSLLQKQIGKMSDAEIGASYVRISRGAQSARLELEKLNKAFNSVGVARNKENARIQALQRNIDIEAKLIRIANIEREREQRLLGENLTVRAQAIAGRARELRRIEQLQGHMRQNINAMNKAGAASRLWSINTNKLLSNLYKLRWSIFSVVALVYMFNRAVQAVIDGLRGGAGLNEQLVTLNALSSKWGTTAKSMIDDMRDLSAGILSTGNMVNLANKALLAGLSPETIKGFAELSRAINRITGEEPEKIFEKFVTGTARATERAIAFTGVIVSARLAVVEYAKANNLTVEVLTDLQKKEAFHQAVLAKKDDIIKSVNLKYKTQAERISELTANFKNMGDEIKRTLANIFFPPEGAEKTLQRIRDIRDELEDLNKKSLRWGTSFGVFTPDVQMQKTIKALKDELKLLEGKQEKLNLFKETNDKLQLQYEKINQLRDKTLNKEERIGEQLALHKRQVVELMAELTRQHPGKGTESIQKEFELMLGTVKEIEDKLNSDRLDRVAKQEEKERNLKISGLKKTESAYTSYIKNIFNAEKKGLQRSQKNYKKHFAKIKSEFRSHINILKDIATGYYDFLEDANKFKEELDKRGLTQTELFEKAKENVRVATLHAQTATDEESADKYKVALEAQMQLIRDFQDKVREGGEPVIDIDREKQTFNHLLDMYKFFAEDAISVQKSIADAAEEEMVDTQEMIDVVSGQIATVEDRYRDFVDEIKSAQLEMNINVDPALMSLDGLIEKLREVREQIDNTMRAGDRDFRRSDFPETPLAVRGSLATGVSRINADGLYRLHKNETVTQSGRDSTNPINNINDNSSVTFVLGKSTVSPLEELEMRRLLRIVNSDNKARIAV